MVAAILLILAVVAFRVAGAVFEGDFLANFSPLASIFLCGALFLPRRIAIYTAFGALLLSDIIVNTIYGSSLLSPYIAVRYFALGLVFALGLWMRQRNVRQLGAIFGAVVGSAVVFYLVTNTASWVAEPAYAKSMAGWWQALTVGLPGFPPTWTFFRNALAGDLFFTALFLIAVRPYARLRPAVPESAASLPAQSRS